MNTRTFVVSLAVLCVGAVAQAQSFTVATFSDPSNDPNSPLFTATSADVVGSWLGTGLDLVIPETSTTYNDVKMNMDSVSRTGTALGSGMISFWDTDMNNPLFTIEFEEAVILEPFFASASFIEGQDVTFGGSAIASLQPLSAEQFSFSFANPFAGQGFNTYTASMTSSAVPEPASMIALGLGVAALASRKKRKA